MSMTTTTPPPSLAELELLLEQRKVRLIESLHRPRAELLQRISSRLLDLRPPHDLSDLRTFELGVLAMLAQVRQELEEAREIERSYGRSVTQATQEAERAKIEYDRCDPLTGALEQRKTIERYHTARIEAEVYEEVRDQLQTSLAELERGLTRRIQGLQSECDVYVNAKIMTMAREAEESLEEAHRKMVHAQQLKLRAEAFEGEFRTRYGLEQEGHSGITKV